MKMEDWKSRKLEMTYKYHPLPAKKQRKGRPAGGFLFGWRTDLSNSPEIVQTTEHGIFLKVLTPTPTLLVFSYIAPDDRKKSGSQNQKRWKEKAAELFSQLTCLSQSYPHVILMGDMNARIGMSNSDHRFPRKSRDSSTNPNGKPFLSHAAEAGIIVLNGRTPGDMEGHFTLVNGANAGCSSVDLALSSPSLTPSITTLQVLEWAYSDHFPLFLELNAQSVSHSNPAREQEKIIVPTSVPERPEFSKCLDEAIEALPSPADVEGANQALHSTIMETCRARNAIRRPKSHTAPPTWFDMECKTQKWKKKNALRKLQRSRDPNHPVLAKEYIKTKTSYKALIRQKQDAYDALMVSKLHKANHPDGLWRAVEYFCPSFTLPNIIPKNTWFQHFKRVFSNTSSRTLSAPGLPTTLDPILDRDINPFEITLATKQLKAGKSAGPDLLPNEIWKLRTPHLMLYLLSLFQLILDTGKLPVMWCMARITPIHKKGPLDDPKNYRPISILSTALKLFTKILNERLKEWVASQNKISDFQAGFRKRRSCADHIFTLMSMIQIQLLQNQELYVVFVDLSQAFDTPDHNLLWSVLLRMGVSQKFLSSLQFLYESASAVVSTAFGPTEPIKIMKGVLQGESASPTLFNLFIEELVNKFLNSLYRGFKIGQRLVHLLLYADDLAIVAQSKELLQEKIKLAAKFLISRGLKVNLSKTKVVVF